MPDASFRGELVSIVGEAAFRRRELENLVCLCELLETQIFLDSLTVCQGYENVWIDYWLLLVLWLDMVVLD